MDCLAVDSFSVILTLASIAVTVYLYELNIENIVSKNCLIYLNDLIEDS